MVFHLIIDSFNSNTLVFLKTKLKPNSLRYFDFAHKSLCFFEKNYSFAMILILLVSYSKFAPPYILVKIFHNLCFSNQ